MCHECGPVLCDMKELIDVLRRDWLELKDEFEIALLRKWSEDSRKNVLMYAGAVYGSMAPFMLGPLVPPLLRLIPKSLIEINPNLTMAKPLMFHVEYFIDINKYYYPLVIHSYFGTMTYITVVVAIDTMFMTYVQRACAIFNIVGYRLEKLVDDHDLDANLNPTLRDDASYKRMTECIIRHSKAIQYAQLIESANSTSFLLQLGLNMITISFTGFQAATKLNRPDEAFRYASFTCAQTFHLFFESWPAQRLVDESTRLTEYTIKTSWYKTSFRSRKLFQLLIMKSMEPCQLTAGGVYILNLENFSAVVKTSMSYFTVLCSTT
ncbi:odorant receptor 13a isoform X1 [Diachasma alloeum]|uniref:odorant receptor 13a isoform X1 n=1 Tax=Diachasma alloeum TaxID=454923 RepID=UPI0007380FF5|nr:odorant receptor 13a isoform X1 [Diachasma alloeum]